MIRKNFIQKFAKILTLLCLFASVQQSQGMEYFTVAKEYIPFAMGGYKALQSSWADIKKLESTLLGRFIKNRVCDPVKNPRIFKCSYALLNGLRSGIAAYGLTLGMNSESFMMRRFCDLAVLGMALSSPQRSESKNYVSHSTRSTTAAGDLGSLLALIVCLPIGLMCMIKCLGGDVDFKNWGRSNATPQELLQDLISKKEAIKAHRSLLYAHVKDLCKLREEFKMLNVPSSDPKKHVDECTDLIKQACQLEVGRIQKEMMNKNFEAERQAAATATAPLARLHHQLKLAIASMNQYKETLHYIKQHAKNECSVDLLADIQKLIDAIEHKIIQYKAEDDRLTQSCEYKNAEQQFKAWQAASAS